MFSAISKMVWTIFVACVGQKLASVLSSMPKAASWFGLFDGCRQVNPWLYFWDFKISKDIRGCQDIPWYPDILGYLAYQGILRYWGISEDVLSCLPPPGYPRISGDVQGYQGIPGHPRISGDTRISEYIRGYQDIWGYQGIPGYPRISGDTRISEDIRIW